MDQAVILSAVRTPIGKFQGGLAPLSARNWARKSSPKRCAARASSRKPVDEIIMGNVVQAGLGQNPARQAGLGAGLDVRVAAMTINKVCGSGLKAVGLAAQGVMLGETEIVVAGGMESMSNCPYLLPGARTGYRFGNAEVVDSMVRDGLWDVYNDFHMGITAELVAEKYGITRQEQDQFALESHQRAVRARKSCFIESQIVPIEIPQKKGEPVVIKYDESPREDASLEALAKLRPAFKKDGTVTAGNAPGTNDGAAALVVTSEQNAARLGKTPMARIVAQAVSGVDPKWIMIAPVYAVEKILEKTGWDRDTRRRPVRIERSVCRGRHRRDARVAPRSRESERERRRRGHRASHRRFRRAHSDHAALRNAAAQRTSRNRRAVPRRRQRRRVGGRAVAMTA